MQNGIGLTVTQRVRVGDGDVRRGGDACDPALLLALFGDVASELLARLDGDEGQLRRFEGIEFLAPVCAGDVVEATGVITQVGSTSRGFAFEARKVVTRVTRSGQAPTAADALESPIVVCRAIGSASVSTERQRKPRLVLPALAAGRPSSDLASLPEPHAVITPAPHVIVTPPNTEVIVVARILVTGDGREAALEAAACREAGAAIVTLSAMGSGAALGATIARIRKETDLLVEIATGSEGSAAARSAMLSDRPDLGGIDCGSTNWAGSVRSTSAPMMRDLAQRVRRAGATASLHCYDLGHVQRALSLAGEALPGAPPFLKLVLGSPDGLDASEATLRLLSSFIPASALWCLAATGEEARALSELSLRLGGHVSVGDDAEGPAKANKTAHEAVRHMASRAAQVGRQVVDPARARALLGATEPPSN